MLLLLCLFKFTKRICLHRIYKTYFIIHKYLFYQPISYNSQVNKYFEAFYFVIRYFIARWQKKNSTSFYRNAVRYTDRCIPSVHKDQIERGADIYERKMNEIRFSHEFRQGSARVKADQLMTRARLIQPFGSRTTSHPIPLA